MPRKGYRQSAEHRARISEAMKRRWAVSDIVNELLDPANLGDERIRFEAVADMLAYQDGVLEELQQILHGRAQELSDEKLLLFGMLIGVHLKDSLISAVSGKGGNDE